MGVRIGQLSRTTYSVIMNALDHRRIDYIERIDEECPVLDRHVFVELLRIVIDCPRLNRAMFWIHMVPTNVDDCPSRVV